MSDIRRLLSYNCYKTSDVSVNVRCLISDVCCHITVTRRLITVNVRCLISDVCCHITVIRCLMSDIICYVINCYQTSDVNDVCCLISDLWYDIRYFITVILQQSSDVSVNVRCLISDVCCHITVTRRLITVNVRCLISDVCCHITVLRRLMLYVMLYNCYQTSHNSYMKADVWYQTSYINRYIEQT